MDIGIESHGYSKMKILLIKSSDFWNPTFNSSIATKTTFEEFNLNKSLVLMPNIVQSPKQSTTK